MRARLIRQVNWLKKANWIRILNSIYKYAASKSFAPIPLCQMPKRLLNTLHSKWKWVRKQLLGVFDYGISSTRNFSIQRWHTKLNINQKSSVKCGFGQTNLNWLFTIFACCISYKGRMDIGTDRLTETVEHKHICGFHSLDICHLSLTYTNTMLFI